MAANVPTSHHIVPRHILKAMSEDNETLFAFDRRRPHDGVFSAKISKLLVENHRFSYRNPDNSVDPSPELFLSRLEGVAAPVFSRIVLAARRGTKAPLTWEDHEIINLFMNVQWKRANESVKPWMVEQFDAIIQRGITEFEENYRPLSEDEQRVFSTAEARKRLRRNAIAGVVTKHSPEIMTAMRSVGLHVVQIAIGARRAFVTGSKPIVKLTDEKNTTLGHPDVELWMPISFDVALVKCGPPNYQLLTTSDAALIRNTNCAIARQSTLIAAKSRELVASVVRSEPTLLVEDYQSSS